MKSAASRPRLVVGAILASIALHVGALSTVAAWGRGRSSPAPPVYAVTLVSPPPVRAGPPDPGAGSPSAESGTRPAAPLPSGSDATPPRRSPPAPDGPSTDAASAAVAMTLRSRPSDPRPGSAAAHGAAGASNSGVATPSARSTHAPEPGEAPRDATGPRPDPTSPGGEDLRVATGGLRCPDPEYCANIVRQIHRFFRRPESARSDEGEVCFRIERDGSASDLRVERLRGSPAFRVALLEAAEQAGRRRAFGPLPPTFEREWLPVCVRLRPQQS